jgi:hypothetical protein
MSDLINKMFLELPDNMRTQAVETNKAFKEMIALQDQIRDIGELLGIATAKWKREDRLWKDMVKDYPPKPAAESEG